MCQVWATRSPGTIESLDASIECTCTIDAPIAEVFAFHLDTRNAARISPPGQRVLSVEGAFELELGSEVRLSSFRSRQARTRALFATIPR